MKWTFCVCIEYTCPKLISILLSSLKVGTTENNQTPNQLFVHWMLTQPQIAIDMASCQRSSKPVIPSADDNSLMYQYVPTHIIIPTLREYNLVIPSHHLLPECRLEVLDFCGYKTCINDNAHTVNILMLALAYSRILKANVF